MSLSFKALAAQSFTLYYSTTTRVICNRHALAHKCLSSRSKWLTRFNPDGINSLQGSSTIISHWKYFYTSLNSSWKLWYDKVRTSGFVVWESNIRMGYLRNQSIPSLKCLSQWWYIHKWGCLKDSLQLIYGPWTWIARVGSILENLRKVLVCLHMNFVLGPHIHHTKTCSGIVMCLLIPPMFWSPKFRSQVWRSLNGTQEAGVPHLWDYY